jgi:tRNA (adenine9-N1/guanine9-N1)-methyltransferase
VKFKRPKEIFCKELYRLGVKRPKFLFNPGRGDFLNRTAYRVVKGKYGILRKEDIPEIKPGKLIEKCKDVEFLGFKGNEIPDSALVRRRGTVDLSYIEFKYPDVGIDLSFFRELLLSEKKSLAVQLELSYGIVKDYLTPENFFVFNVTPEARKFLEKFFKPKVPFKLRESIEDYSNVIVLDPNAENEFNHEEVDEETLIVVGGIVDSSERLKGSTKRILRGFKHRKITYKGIVSIVPDRINEIVKIVLDYLTSPDELCEVVRRNLTRDSKLRFLRQFLEREIVRFLVNGKIVRGIPEEKFKWLIEEFGFSDFIFKKASKHVSGFIVFKSSIFDKVLGETEVRGRKVFMLKEISDEDVLKKYP